uniref:Uncharacterized protein n=1 Tax=Cacopsylla melanoneura TaxID=428564 RepID=A0A8D8LDN0_9HEMI
MNIPLHFLKLSIRLNRMKIGSSLLLLSRRHTDSSMTDALSILTDHLVQRRIEKRMDKEGVLFTDLDKNYNILLDLNMNDSEMELLDTIKAYLKKYVDRKDVPAKPPIKLLDNLAYYFIQRNDLEGLQLIISVHKLDYVEFVRNGEFKHYLIDYYRHTNRIDASFEIINDYYKLNNSLHFLMKLSLKTLISSVVLNHSEATLVRLISRVKSFSSTYNEHYPIFILWKSLFSSEWHSDQTEARQLFLAYPEVQVYVSIICVNFSVELLNQKKVQAVETLLEWFLELKNKDDSGEEKYKKQCVLLMRSLFDYQCMARNQRACTEIVKSSYELDLPLTEDQKVQFFNVLLRNPIEKKLITPLHKTVYPLKF